MATRQLEEKLTCAICLGLYRDPATLPCGHNFCGKCIGDWLAHQVRECPECRELVPDGTVLRRNVALRDVVELVVAAEQAPAPPPGPGAPPGPAARCPRHGRPLELFCRTEGRCVCSACTVLECRLHERSLLEDARREREAQLRTMLEMTAQRATQAEAQLRELQQQSSQIQDSACGLASTVSAKLSCLLQALELRRVSVLRDLEAAKAQELAKARDGEQQLRSHLEALTVHEYRMQNLLAQQDDCVFLQQSLILVPPEPLGPLPPLQWDEDQQLGDLKELLSRLGSLLLEEEPREVLDVGPVETPGPLASVSSPACPLRRELWQNYRNLTFDPDSANRHLHLSWQNRQVKHCRKPRGPVGPRSFDLWQVQCAQSFETGRHYWEVRASSHSVMLGVAYPELERSRQGRHTTNIGRGPFSWGLCIQEDGSQAWHNGETWRLPPVSGRLLGVDLDLTSGCLTFYSLEPQTQRLHTFHAVFTRPLHPVFWLLEDRTLTLCHRPGP
ncbi:E3 ubiquitin-protein ligase TRIM65 [Tenrec ecaudatus]|uniref:E3 ubiquitin-protein ligase TRIM65 n=1 Tax=Tenrec ecaudatus TaxID=94439 RepID=UPI003F593757